jgi:hypothetical protein
MAVLGSEPELLFYAHQRSATGYIYMYDLVDEQPYRQRMTKEMISEVEQTSPDYVVFVNLITSWLPAKPEYFQTIQKWLTNYTATQYDPYLVVTAGSNQYALGPDCLRQVPPAQRLVVVYQRKPTGAAGGILSK